PFRRPPWSPASPAGSRPDLPCNQPMPRRRTARRAPRCRMARAVHGKKSSEVQLLEEVIALVVDHDEGRKILDLDAPDRLHAELGIFQHLDLFDAVLRQVGRGAADRAEIEAAVLRTGLPHSGRA